jgi:hypothetical protein
LAVLLGPWELVVELMVAIAVQRTGSVVIRKSYFVRNSNYWDQHGPVSEVVDQVLIGNNGHSILHDQMVVLLRPRELGVELMVATAAIVRPRTIQVVLIQSIQRTGSVVIRKSYFVRNSNYWDQHGPVSEVVDQVLIGNNGHSILHDQMVVLLRPRELGVELTVATAAIVCPMTMVVLKQSRQRTGSGVIRKRNFVRNSNYWDQHGPVSEVTFQVIIGNKGHL